MFSLQDSLGVTPIPTLQNSCKKFLQWVEPLLSEQAFRSTSDQVEKFLELGGDGEQLQRALLMQSNHNRTLNWDCATWLELYLSARYPLVINSNVFYYLKNKLDPTSFSPTQIASALLMCVYEFNEQIENETLSIDLQKSQPLCMQQYKNLFSSTRIPQKGSDKLVTASGKTYIVVLYNEHIFKLNLVNENGIRHSFFEIDGALQKIIKVKTVGQNIGLFTTLARDEWADSRVALKMLSNKNSDHLALIEGALFSLSLDQNMPETLHDTSKMLWHGDGKNRFFDKSLQFIVFKNGKMGINFEHAGMDGAIMQRLMGHIYDRIDSFPNDIKTKQVIEHAPLNFTLDDNLQRTLAIAQQSFKKSVADFQTRIIKHTLFGKDKIKEFAVSPDAFLQIALQLAEYKLHGKCTSAYEAIMTRTFAQGRIDVLFTVSMESLNFIKNIGNDNLDQQTKRDLLKKAANKHISRAKECREGNGIYTHLLALTRCYEVEGEQLGITKLPSIFTDLGYQTLTHNMICSSTTSEYGVELAGYGPIVADGYGIRYFIRADSIDFNITGKTDNQKNLDLLTAYIQESLIEMAELMK